MGPTQVVRNLGDVGNVRIDYDVTDFERAFFSIFDNTQVIVLGIISIVFIIRRYLESFERDRSTSGRQLILLY